MTKNYISCYLLTCVLVALALGCSDDLDAARPDASTGTNRADAETLDCDAGISCEPDAEANPDAAADEPVDPAEGFCIGFRETCGLEGDGRFSSVVECHVFYDGVSAERQACVEQHLDLAADDPDTHCPHATGRTPCD